jgi:ABC-2 type transport system permease protein
MTDTTTFEPTLPPAARRTLKNRPGLRQSIRDSLVMAYRGLLKMRRTPEQFFDVTLQPTVFTLMFTYLFGGAISGDVLSYLPIIIPGILVQTVLTTSMSTGVQLREDMDEGVFNRFRTLPIARVAPLAGALLADTVRFGIAAVLTLIMGYIMGYRPNLGGIVVGGLLVMFAAWCISWIFALLGVMARSASSVHGMATVVLFPLTFLSNAFVPAHTLPGWLQMFVHYNPVSHLVSSVRELAGNGVIGQDFWLTLLGSFIIVAIFAPLTVRAYMRHA